MPHAVSPSAPVDSSRPSNRLGDTLLWLLLFLVTFALPQKPALELDSSWRQALGYFLAHDFQFGTEVVFTYGPLGYLMGNTFGGLGLGWLLAWQFAFSVFAASFVLAFSRGLTGVARFAYFTFFVLWGLGYPDALHMILLAMCGWALINRFAAKQPPHEILFGLLLAFFAVIKFTNLLFTGFVVVVVTAYGLSRGERRATTRLLASYAGGFLLLWLFCGQSVFNLPAYVINSLDISSGYQASMGLPTPTISLTKALAVMVGIAAYTIWHFVTQPDRIRSAAQFLILAAFLFLNWKHGFVRADGHMLGFFYCALIPCIAFPVLFGEGPTRRGLGRGILVVTAFCCLWGMRTVFTSNIDYAANIANERLQRNIQAFLAPRDFMRDVAGGFSHWERVAELERTKEIVGDASIDVLGFEQSIALFNHFNYRPRPVFQSYSAYTPGLIGLNADYLTGADAPEFLLWKLQTIDERPPTMDDSSVLALLPHLYRFELEEKDFQLWRRRDPAPDLAALAPHPARTIDLVPDEPVDISAFGTTHLWLEIDLRFSLFGRLRNFLYKPPIVHLDVTDFDGKVVNYRLPLPGARAGFQLNPLITDIPSFLEAHGGEHPRLVASITLRIDDADRTYLASTAFATLATLQPTQAKPEYEKQLEREKFSVFFDLPIDFSAETAPSKLEIDGRDALVLHAPSMAEFPLRAGATRIAGAHGYPEGAYTNGGETDGAVFSIRWTNADGTEERTLYSRTLDPFNVPADRGLVDFAIDVTDVPPGLLFFETAIRNHNAWDWTAWSGITVE